jgi:hypothetical protein
LVGSNHVGVSVVLNDPTSQWNDILREVGNEGDVSRAEKIRPKERVKVWTWESGDIAAGAGEVRGDRFLVVAFVGIQKDIAKGG